MGWLYKMIAKLKLRPDETFEKERRTNEVMSRADKILEEKERLIHAVNLYESRRKDGL